MRIVALDYGEKRIGVAVAQTEVGIALPIAVLPADLQVVLRFLKEQKPDRIVVGIPYRLSGEAGQRAQQVQAFIDALREQLDIPIDTIDERFSSREAESRLLQAGYRRRARRAIQDSVAAALLLETYLNRWVKMPSDEYN
ncbi:Putative pre-16S rRNA nuclease [bacterium HR15]|nr:Putative pre-16S rRNA nuclease [bacterium HR15]